MEVCAGVFISSRACWNPTPPNQELARIKEAERKMKEQKEKEEWEKRQEELKLQQQRLR